MSKAQLDQFISVISEDPAALRDASKGEADLQQCARNLVDYAKARGYDFSEEEARAWLAEQSGRLAGGELNDAQLESVAGGIIVIGGRTTRGATSALPGLGIKTGWGNPPDDSKAGWGAPPDDNRPGWGTPPDDGKTL